MLEIKKFVVFATLFLCATVDFMRGRDEIAWVDKWKMLEDSDDD